jgi:hypothetical protein
MARTTPTVGDAKQAAVLALAAIANRRDVHDVAAELAELHPKHNTFPGEVLLGLAADALLTAGVSRHDPIEAEGLLERYLPEANQRGVTGRYKIRYALYAAPALAGGVKPDLLDEVAWRTDDFWYYALLILDLYVRAAADKSGEDVAALCRDIAHRKGLTLPA